MVKYIKLDYTVRAEDLCEEAYEKAFVLCCAVDMGLAD